MGLPGLLSPPKSVELWVTPTWNDCFFLGPLCSVVAVMICSPEACLATLESGSLRSSSFGRWRKWHWDVGSDSKLDCGRLERSVEKSLGLIYSNTDVYIIVLKRKAGWSHHTLCIEYSIQHSGMILLPSCVEELRVIGYHIPIFPITKDSPFGIIEILHPYQLFFKTKFLVLSCRFSFVRYLCFTWWSKLEFLLTQQDIKNLHVVFSVKQESIFLGTINFSETPKC